jgi:hypothetical protein
MHGEAGREEVRVHYGRRGLLGGLSALTILSVGATCRAEAVDPNSEVRRAGGLAIYFAAIPAAFVLGHPPEHTGEGQHGGPPEDHYAHHLIVVVFDASTGTRITDAAVTAVVHGRKHAPDQRITLEPMSVGGAMAYGGFANMGPRDYYRVEIEVMRQGGAAPVQAVFWHRHWQP